MTTRTRRRPPRARRADLATDPGMELRSGYHIGAVRSLALAAGAESDDEQTATASVADVYVFGNIGGWSGVTSDDFVRDVVGLDVDRITLHLNSGGGAASEGTAIRNVLRAHRATVKVRVYAMAASAASVIATAASPYDPETGDGGVEMCEGAEMMVHDAWGYTSGNAAAMRKYAESLDSASNAYASIYAARAGGTAEDWRAVMEAETWYTAEEAVTAGLADRVVDPAVDTLDQGEQVTPGRGGGSFWDFWDSLASADLHDLSRYAYAGREAAPPPRFPTRQTPAASAAGHPNTQERGRDVAFSPEQLDTMRQHLGLADDADEAAIVAALARPAEPPAPRTAPGTVVLDETAHAQLVADATAGREARTQQLAERRASLVQAAVTDGRIPPARRAHWLAYLEADPGAEETLANLQTGMVPLAEIGYQAKDDTPTADPADSDDYWFPGFGGPAKVEG